MHNLHRVGLVFIVAVVTLSVAGLVAAQTEPLSLQGGSSALCPEPEQYSQQRPRASEGPTQVGVGVLLVDLVSLDDVDQSFTADVGLILRWSDPRLADPARGASVSVCPNATDRAWMPVVQFQRVRRVREALSGRRRHRRRWHRHPRAAAEFANRGSARPQRLSVRPPQFGRRGETGVLGCGGGHVLCA